jgi:hypothetical protein
MDAEKEGVLVWSRNNAAYHILSSHCRTRSFVMLLHWKYVMSSLDDPTSGIDMGSMSPTLRSGMYKLRDVHTLSWNPHHSKRCSVSQLSRLERQLPIHRSLFSLQSDKQGNQVPLADVSYQRKENEVRNNSYRLTQLWKSIMTYLRTRKEYQCIVQYNMESTSF